MQPLIYGSLNGKSIHLRYQPCWSEECAVEIASDHADGGLRRFHSHDFIDVTSGTVHLASCQTVTENLILEREIQTRGMGSRTPATEIPTRATETRYRVMVMRYLVGENRFAVRWRFAAPGVAAPEVVHYGITG